MNTFYSIFISTMAFFLVVMISFILDNMLFTDPNPSEDKLLTIIKLFIEISIICIITFLILSNIKEIAIKYNITDSNNLLFPIIIAWIIVINYYFKNKIFGKFNILFNDFVNIPNNINVNKNQINYSTNTTYRKNDDSNNSNIPENIVNQSNSNNILNSNIINKPNKNQNKDKKVINSRNINDNQIFKKHHNKDWYKSNFDITNYYPELLKQDNNIRSGKYEYVEVNNLKN